jgi:hypothetical protein
MCEAFNCLPQAGGLFDQHPLVMSLILRARIVRNQKAEEERKRKQMEQKAKASASRHP